MLRSCLAAIQSPNLHLRWIAQSENPSNGIEDRLASHQHLLLSSTRILHEVSSFITANMHDSGKEVVRDCDCKNPVLLYKTYDAHRPLLVATQEHLLLLMIEDHT